MIGKTFDIWRRGDSGEWLFCGSGCDKEYLAKNTRGSQAVRFTKHGYQPSGPNAGDQVRRELDADGVPW